MPNARSTVSHTTPPLDQSARLTTPLELVCPDSPTDDEIEQGLLAVDPDAQMAEVIAMPPSIREPLREMIVGTLCARFEFYDDLEAWLYAPSVVLGGETPFERVALGDGEAVLLALGIAAPTTTLLASGRDLSTHVVKLSPSHHQARGAVARRRSHKR